MVVGNELTVESIEHPTIMITTLTMFDISSSTCGWVKAQHDKCNNLKRTGAQKCLMPSFVLLIVQVTVTCFDFLNSKFYVLHPLAVAYSKLSNGCLDFFSRGMLLHATSYV
ncbi:hypothetical protein WN943_023589 [Citrus x changshan-huyou]